MVPSLGTEFLLNAKRKTKWNEKGEREIKRKKAKKKEKPLCLDSCPGNSVPALVQKEKEEKRKEDGAGFLANPLPNSQHKPYLLLALFTGN